MLLNWVGRKSRPFRHRPNGQRDPIRTTTTGCDDTGLVTNLVTDLQDDEARSRRASQVLVCTNQTWLRGPATWVGSVASGSPDRLDRKTTICVRSPPSLTPGRGDERLLATVRSRRHSTDPDPQQSFVHVRSSHPWPVADAPRTGRLGRGQRRSWSSKRSSSSKPRSNRTA